MVTMSEPGTNADSVDVRVTVIGVEDGATVGVDVGSSVGVEVSVGSGDGVNVAVICVAVSVGGGANVVTIEEAGRPV